MKNTGFYNKYQISRTDGTPMNPENEYFILKIAGEGDDFHINACRKALMTYADEIEAHLPELSKDLRQKYGDVDDERFKDMTQEKFLQLSFAARCEYIKHVLRQFQWGVSGGEYNSTNIEVWNTHVERWLPLGYPIDPVTTCLRIKSKITEDV